MGLEYLRIAKFRRGDGVAADDLEHQAEGHHRRKRQALAPDRSHDEQRHHDPHHAGTPLQKTSEKSGSIGRKQQRRKDAGHEEDKRVQESEDAEAGSRPAEEIVWKARRDLPSRGARLLRMHESNVQWHARLQASCGAQSHSRSPGIGAR